jgi:hypothetical protein
LERGAFGFFTELLLLLLLLLLEGDSAERKDALTFKRRIEDLYCHSR